MPPLVNEDLCAIEDPLVPIALGSRLEALDVGPRLRLGDGIGAELEVVVGPEALGHPAHDLLGRAGSRDPGGGQAGARDRQRQTGAAPVQLLGVDHRHLAVGVGSHALQVLDALQAPIAGLLDDLPRNAFVTVVLGRCGPHDLLCEATAVRLEFQLLLIQCEVH